jgi:hypothetical protein
VREDMINEESNKIRIYMYKVIKFTCIIRYYGARKKSKKYALQKKEGVINSSVIHISLRNTIRQRLIAFKSFLLRSASNFMLSYPIYAIGERTNMATDF